MAFPRRDLVSTFARRTESVGSRSDVWRPGTDARLGRLARSRLRTRARPAALRTPVPVRGGWFDEPPEVERLHGFVTANPDLRDLFDQIRQMADADLPVLILGETGVGKTLLARTVHETSARAAAPFVALSCAAVPDSLMESELVGHLAGAYTGAEEPRDGVFVEADGGTLLLDDVADMSPAMQTKLLRLLEDGVVRPLGGGASSARRVDVRIVAAASSDLEPRVRAGSFRRDLYFRLRGAVFEIAPLRERPEDVPGLAAEFLARYTRKGTAPTLSRSALEVLSADPWPGNVRELENEMRRLAALELPEIAADSLFGSSRDRRPAVGVSGETELEAIVADAERRAVESALAYTRGNRTQAAERLGITRKALYRRIEKYGL